MRKNFIIAAISSLLAFVTAAHAQQLYRWVDQNGRVTYSQSPPPAGAAKNVQQRNLGGGSVVESSDLPYAAQVAVKNFPVTLYTGSDCGDPCKQGRDALSKRGIPFREISVGDAESLDALRKIAGSARIPTLQIGAQAVAGFEAISWKNALDAAGYPASIPVSTRRQNDTLKPRSLPVVKLYSSPQCGPPCENAKNALSARNIGFQEVVVGSEESLVELNKVSGSRDLLPVLLVGASLIVGFDAPRYQSALDNAGFPKTAGAAAK